MSVSLVVVATDARCKARIQRSAPSPTISCDVSLLLRLNNSAWRLVNPDALHIPSPLRLKKRSGKVNTAVSSKRKGLFGCTAKGSSSRKRSISPIILSALAHSLADPSSPLPSRERVAHDRPPNERDTRHTGKNGSLPWLMRLLV